ncbi:MAG: hypothetical protein OEZ47_11905 [Gammaproteobacteria bacterium]|nr:hypothetical protein [Gammaproteobacteria bacterium]
MKALQTFSHEYLNHCKRMSADEILHFLEGFRQLHGQGDDKSRLISIKIPESLLSSFRFKCELNGLKYQTQIKRLMKDWL